MTSEEWQWILQDLSLQCHSSSLRLLKRGRGDYMQDPSLQCQWTAEHLGDLVGITGCIFKIKVMCGGQS